MSKSMLYFNAPPFVGSRLTKKVMNTCLNMEFKKIFLKEESSDKIISATPLTAADKRQINNQSAVSMGFKTRKQMALYFGKGIDWTNSVNLGFLMSFAAYDVHGGLTLSYDGDCFVPPPCRVSLTGWSGCYRGCGRTIQEAVVRALYHKISMRNHPEYANRKKKSYEKMGITFASWSDLIEPEPE